jgi:hypothetical protein
VISKKKSVILPPPPPSIIIIVIVVNNKIKLHMQQTKEKDFDAKINSFNHNNILVI